MLRIKKESSLSKGIMMYKHYGHGDFVDYADKYKTYDLGSYVNYLSDNMYYNGPGTLVPAKYIVGNAYDFDMGATNDFSFYLEVKPIINTGESVVYLAGADGALPGYPGFCIGLYLSKIYGQIFGVDVTSGNEAWYYTPESITYKEKYKILLTVDRVNQLLKVYINGIYRGSDDTSDQGSLNGTVNAKFTFGNLYYNGGNSSASANAEFYESIVYNRALTESESLQLTSPEFSLLEPIKSIKQEVLMALYPDDGNPIAVNDAYDVIAETTLNIPEGSGIISNDNYGCT